MSNPSVCAVLLTADRPERTARAVKAFLAQRYEPKSLLVFDNGFGRYESRQSDIAVVRFGKKKNESIGMLRNLANGCVPQNADILMHWDSDDVSHPFRMAEQVAELERTQADCVGYPELLMYDSRIERAFLYKNADLAHWMPGTTLCYWRRTWRRIEFPDINTNEDAQWLQKVRAVPGEYWGHWASEVKQPRVIAEIHGKNTVTIDGPKLCQEAPKQWMELPDMVGHCHEVMEL